MLTGQALVLSWANLRAMRTRAVSATVAILGFAGVATMLLVPLSGREAIRSMYQLAGRDDVAIIKSGPSTYEVASYIAQPLVLEIARMPGIARDASGEPLISKELSDGARLPRKQPGQIGRIVTSRGVTPVAFTLRPHFQIVSGRNFRSGLHEVIVGRAVAAQNHVAVGDEVRINRTNLQVVGIFSSGGSSIEMEVWLDKAVLESLVAHSAAATETTSALWVRLARPHGLTQLQEAIASSTTEAMRLAKIRAQSERGFLSAQSMDLIQQATRAAIAVGVVMGIGALFGAINTMYAAVGQRSREIATLRALGFQSFPVAMSVVTEAVALSLAGGLLGVALVSAIARNVSFATYNSAANSYVALHFEPTTGVLMAALGYVLLLGVASSILPCIRALRGSIPAGLFAR